MGLELLRDGITGQKISDLEREMQEECDSEEAVLEYIAKSKVGIERQQPLLMTFLKVEGTRYGVLDHPLFSFASILTFRLLPEELRLEKLKRQVFSVVRRDIREHTHSRRGKLTIDLSWLGDKLNDVCPAYISWLRAIVEDFEDQEKKTAFTLGSYFTIMPFFSREEAKDLEQRFPETQNCIIT